MPLSADDIKRPFAALADELERRHQRSEILVVGGAALVLLFGARESTKDVDACFLTPEASVVRHAAEVVANRLDLPVDWLNDGAKGYLVGVSAGEVLFHSQSLIVRAASTAQLLAMKLAAWRDAIDRSDATLLLSQMAGSAEEIWSTIKPFVPSRQLDKGRTRSKTYGRHSMDIRELVHALLAGDLLTARQCVADAQRAHVQWERLERPHDMTEREIVVAAAMIELLASRSGATPPPWTKTVGAVRELLVLDPGLEQMPRSFAHARAAGPEPLRKRNIVALPDFLDVA